MKLKNKKGFTLIELLAVIVVLAIIALIATPIVMNTIKNAKKGAAERSADNYIKQVETTIAEKKLENNPLADGPYTIDSNGNLTGNGLTESVTIDMNGTKPKSGTVTISNGTVSKDGTKLVVGDYNVKYKEDKLTASEPYKGVLCKANTTKSTALVWTGTADPQVESSYTEQEVGLLASEATSKYDVGVTYTCDLGDSEDSKNLIFYVLETSGDNVSLIMNANVDSNGKAITSNNIPTDRGYIDWISMEDYLAAGGTIDDWNVTCLGICGNINLGPITANKILKERTSTWTKLDEDQIILPTGQQIASAGGDTKWNVSTQGSGFRSAKWLYSYTSFASKLPMGYWTSPPDVSNASYAWYVGFEGKMYKAVVGGPSVGVRPVITVSKSNLS